MKCFLINLDRSADRLQRMEAEFARVGVRVQRVPAIDGANLPAAQFDEFVRQRPIVPPENWRPAKVGCFLSQQAAWRLVASGSDNAAAIFEDDVHLASDLELLVASDEWLPADADIVRLEGMGNVKLGRGRALPQCSGRHLHRVFSKTFGAAGYIITRRAAQRLIATPAALHHFTDMTLFSPNVSPVARGLRCYQVVPSVCVQDQFAGENRIGIESLLATGADIVLPPAKKAHRRLISLVRPYTKMTVNFRR